MQGANKTKVVLFGSMGVAVACLKWLLRQPELEVVGVVCSRSPRKSWRQVVNDPDMQEFAPVWNIPLLTMDDILSIEADIGLSVRFHQIFRERHLRRFRLGVVNLHGAPLPEMRGSMCDAAAIMEKRHEYGTSLHWMDTGIDTGDLLAEQRFPIHANDTVYDLFRKSNEYGLQLIQSHLMSIIRGDINGKSQQQLATERGIEPRTYVIKDVLEYKKIPSGIAADTLWNVVRAFQFPGHVPAYTESEFGNVYYTIRGDEVVLDSRNEGY